MATKSSTRLLRRILLAFIVVVIAGLAYGAYYINSLLPIITGYPAKYLCSAVFISDRSPAEVEAMDLNFSFIKYVKNQVDYPDSSVTSTFLWGKSKAIYRHGFGCTLLRNVAEGQMREIKFPDVPAPAFDPDTTLWPLGNLMPDSTTNMDIDKLDGIADRLMNNDGYNGHAFAFLVVHKGIVAEERYQPEFNENTRFLSWSMAKSFTNALAGMLVKAGKLDINRPADIPEWQNDSRKSISLNNLMQMQSGLKWNEDYGNRSDVTVMLYCEPDFAKYACMKPLVNPPGTKWSYSSGSANIVSYLIRKAIGNDPDYYRFVQTQLFQKIGIRNAVFEVDPTGTLAGSSYLYATARDYARFGLLYLHDGIFGSERILPEGWVKYTTTAASESNGKYGALFWLNQSGEFPSAPADLFSCNGHDGQHIFIIPSKDLIVVLLGYSPKPDHVMNFDALLGDVISTIKK
jgi:hypothetical protein